MKRFLLPLFLFSSLIYSQKQDVIDKYLQKSLTNEFFDFKGKIEQESIDQENRVVNYLQNNPTKERSFYKDGSFKYLMDVDAQENPIYYTTYNFNGGITVRATDLYQGGSLGLNVEGQDMSMGIWDGGVARFSHVELLGRVQILDGSGMDEHATHVSGTMIATGLNPLLRGIAHKASLKAYSFANDLPEMTTAYQIFGLLVSNHSYGPNAESAPLWLFGGYNNQAKNLDQLVFNSQYYLPVFAAGNDRDNYTTYNPTKNGYDLVGSSNAAKNIITVGAVNQVLNYTSPNSVVMSSFSNWGPTDDGRIKPDVVAKGTSVRSTVDSSDTANAVLQGTSMASPAVAGVAILLQEHYINLNEEPMLSSSLKGLILHTADECGLFQGPDYRFGWGLVNATKAAQLISANGTAAVIDEIALANTSTYSTTLNVVDTSKPLTVSISWTDTAPTLINNGTVDLPNLMLVNDLDVRVTKDGETFFPWTLNPAVPQFPAQNTEDNSRDNFEKIEILEPTAGQYTVTVTHKGNLVGGNQTFSLIAFGGLDQTLSSQSFTASNVSIYPNPASDVLNINSNDTSIQIDAINIYDITGKNIFSQVGNASIDVSNFNNGMYIIEVISDNESVTQKFIKK